MLWNEWGLVGAMVGVGATIALIFAKAVAWSIKRALCKNGIIESAIAEFRRLVDVLDRQHAACIEHENRCVQPFRQIDQLHSGIVALVNEAEHRATKEGFDISEECGRVRRRLEGLTA